MNRRTALAAGIVGTAAGLSGLARQANAQSAPAANVSYYRFRMGDALVTVIHEGVFARPLDGFIRNADLASVKAAQSEAFLNTERVTIPISTLVVQAGGKTILVDAGIGDLGPPGTGLWMANFRAAGFDPGQVDMVVISHFHGDFIVGDINKLYMFRHLLNHARITAHVSIIQRSIYFV